MQSWASILFRLGLIALAGSGVGALYGEPLAGLLIVLLGAFSWHLIWLYRLDKWLRGGKIEFLPEGSGVWPRTFARIEFLRQRGRRRGKRFKALLKQLKQGARTFPDAVVILNSSNEIVLFNRAARDLLGFKKQDRGLSIESLIRSPEFVRYLGSECQGEQLEIASPLQNEQWLSCHIVPYSLDQKMLLVRDVTERRKLDAMRHDFVANASHELRTPLTVLNGYLEAFSEASDIKDEFKAPILEMQGQAMRMQQLVDELLRLSELESEAVVRNADAVGISAIMHTAMQEANASSDCPKVTLILDSKADLQGSARDVQSIVSNLVSNAVRYTPKEGHIELHWEANRKGAFITVKDDGIGIAQEHLPRLCERFYRVEDGRERIGGEGGTGLGLAIVKHALAKHEAELEITSEPGKGSVFTCRFPPERVIPAT